VIFMRRNLTEDIEMRGIPMKKGDKVSLWYNSANRDESRFAHPWLFDVTRDPNPHLGYGGGGAHFCLGANLARREIRVLYRELHGRMPDIVATAEPAILRSAFIHGIKRLPVSFGASEATG
jgi:methyl-branched lipid omega-hydroxylase